MVLKYIRAEIEAYDEAEAEKKKEQGSAESIPDESQYVFENIVLKAPQSKAGSQFSNFVLNTEDAGPYKALVDDFDFAAQLSAWMDAHREELEPALGCKLPEDDLYCGLRVR
jgi:hypothetical protein